VREAERGGTWKGEGGVRGKGWSNWKGKTGDGPYLGEDNGGQAQQYGRGEDDSQLHGSQKGDGGLDDRPAVSDLSWHGCLDGKHRGHGSRAVKMGRLGVGYEGSLPQRVESKSSQHCRGSWGLREKREFRATVGGKI